MMCSLVFSLHHPCASEFWKPVFLPFQKTCHYWNFLFLSKYYWLLPRNTNKKIKKTLQTCHHTSSYICSLLLKQRIYFFFNNFFSIRNLMIFTFYFLILFEREFMEKNEHVEVNHPGKKTPKAESSMLLSVACQGQQPRSTDFPCYKPSSVLSKLATIY